MGRWADMFLLRKRKKCLVCKRVLKSKASVKLGIGPNCARRNPTLAYQLKVEQKGQLRLPLITQGGDDHGKENRQEIEDKQEG